MAPSLSANPFVGLKLSDLKGMKNPYGEVVKYDGYSERSKQQKNVVAFEQCRLVALSLPYFVDWVEKAKRANKDKKYSITLALEQVYYKHYPESGVYSDDEEYLDIYTKAAEAAFEFSKSESEMIQHTLSGCMSLDFELLDNFEMISSD